MIPPANGASPTVDGQVQLYETPDRESLRTWYKPLKRVIYLNGQATSGDRHRECAESLSTMQMCPVVGIYNRSDSSSWHNVIFDTFQSLGDKLQFHGPLTGSPDGYFQKFQDLRESQAGRKLDRAAVMEELLARNPAALATFRLLRSPELPRDTPIFAHSQGNLILSNVLTAMTVVDGPASVLGREVYAYGCPTVNWPAGIRLYDNAFTGDPVAMLNPILNFTISKVGLPTGVSPIGFISHDFMLYLKDDAQFVINRFRWGGWKMTFSMDEDGLASALVQMGNNEPRVRKIFERLNLKHNSDADDVACAYVQKMRGQPGNAALLKTMKGTPLVPLLIRIMDEGWTSAEEKACIDYLKRL